jgi:hypothetical protein
VRAPRKDENALAEKRWRRIEESKAIPWQDLSLEQKYVCLGGKTNEKPGKHVAKTRRNMSLAQNL